MFFKFFLFSMLFWLTGNPFVALIVFLIILYVLDRRFVGISPSVVKPFKRSQRVRQLKQTIHSSPHDVSAKFELARLHMEAKRYPEAHTLLELLQEPLEESADFWISYGMTKLHLGELGHGEALILKGLAINPRAQYGQPYLLLAEKLTSSQSERALQYIEKFKEMNSSSCEGYYLLANILIKLGDQRGAKEALEENLQIYRSLPKYKKRQERRWYVKSVFRKMFLS